jgi:hypothetical protein
MQRDKTNFNQVCKCWYDIVTPMLYQTVVVSRYATWERLDFSLKRFNHSRPLGSYTRVLEIRFKDDDWIDRDWVDLRILTSVFKSLHNVQDLRVDIDGYEPDASTHLSPLIAQCFGHSLRSIQWATPFLHSINNFLLHVRHFPAIEVLVLHISPLDQKNMEPVTIDANAVVLPHLHKLSVGGNFHNFLDWVALRWTIPSLTQVKLMNVVEMLEDSDDPYRGFFEAFGSTIKFLNLDSFPLSDISHILSHCTAMEEIILPETCFFAEGQAHHNLRRICISTQPLSTDADFEALLKRISTARMPNLSRIILLGYFPEMFSGLWWHSDRLEMWVGILDGFRRAGVSLGYDMTQATVEIPERLIRRGTLQEADGTGWLTPSIARDYVVDGW